MMSKEQHEQITFILDLVRNHDVGEKVKVVCLDHMERVVQNTFNFLEFQESFRQAAADEQHPDTIPSDTIDEEAVEAYEAVLDCLRS